MITLEQLICEGESETVEFKTSTASLPKIGETLCGFLNYKGGKVFIGVSAEGKVVGQSVSDNTFREISAILRKIEPSASIEVEQIELPDNKKVIVLTALSGNSDAPYVFDGRPFQRISSTTSIMPQQTYQRLLLERNHSRYRWETEVALGYENSDLDTEEILRTVRMGIAAGRIPDCQEDDIPSILDRLGLRYRGQLLNAAIVLFGKRFLPDFSQCALRLARFKGNDKAEFIDQNQIEGHAFKLLEEAMLFLRRHLPVAGKILPGVLERRDEPLFPLEALREALVNALCHRLYTYPGGAVSIAIFDNRLEIWNDGKLPFGLTVADLKVDHASHQRNPLIASVFFNRGLIERWGRGTQKILNLCIQAGHLEPDFFEQSNSFAVRFLAREYIAPQRIAHDLTERQREIIQILSFFKGKGVTFSDIKPKLSSPPADRTLREDFLLLKQLGRIELTGHGRGARWVLVNKAE